MNIYFDNIIYSLQKGGGISNYWYELTKRFMEQGKNELRFIETSYDNNNLFRKQLAIKETEIIHTKELIKPLHRYLPVALKTPPAEPAIFHSSYYRNPVSRKNLKIITTLHDFIYEHHATGLRKNIHHFQKKRALKASSGVICVSENTRKDLYHFFPEWKDKMVEVIYNGVSDDFFPIPHKSETTDDLKKMGIQPGTRFVLYIGDRAEYKNFSFAVEAASRMEDTTLVIVGGKPFSDSENLQLNTLLAKRYLHLKGISNQQLNLIYNQASCLLYPSSYEGFGMPVIEAMKAGCPVIAMNSSSVGEIAAGYPLLLEKSDICELNEKMDYLSQHKEAVIAEGIKIASKFSWDECFEKTNLFYQNVVKYKI